MAKGNYYYLGINGKLTQLPNFENLDYVESISHDMISVVDACDNWGLVDTKGNLIVNAEFDGIELVDHGVLRAVRGDQYNFYNLKGKLLKELEVNTISDGFINGWMSVEPKNSPQALMNKSFRLKEFPLCEQVNPVDCGIIFKKFGKYGLMDYNFAVVLPNIYDEIEELGDGILLITADVRKQFYDIKNGTFSKCEYEEVRWLENGRAPFQNEDGLWGLLDRKGNVTLKPFLHQAPTIYSKNRLLVKIDKKYLVFGFEGNIVK